MPEHNEFRHQAYAATDTNPDYRFVSPALPESTEPTPQHVQAAQLWRDAGLQAVYVVHGTFTGDDALGLLREIERFAPQWGSIGRQRRKQWVDRFVADYGNYPADYCQRLQLLLALPSTDDGMSGRQARSSAIVVRRFDWSSENLHSGRAWAAIQLLNQLRLNAASGERQIVLWGHSHGGNVFALVTNLLGGSADARQRFFFAIQRMFGGESRPTRADHVAVLHEVRRWLDAGGGRELIASIVTFGTPIRYGWETLGYHRLLHIIHHRSNLRCRPERVEFPVKFEDLWRARWGDVVQQLGIAGTNFLPYFFSFARWSAERRLARLLQVGLPRRQLLARLRQGVRIPNEGMTLLVDYPDDPDHLRQKLLGHAIYTTRLWLAEHVRLISDQWFRR